MKPEVHESIILTLLWFWRSHLFWWL